MEKFTHKIEVIPVHLEPHPNADKLSIVRIYGYTVVVNTALWQGKTQAAYIVPDSLVDTRRPEWDDMADEAKYNEHSQKVEGGHYVRITARKLRGVISKGMLVPAPEGAKLGDNVAEQLGVVHFNPPELEEGGEATRGPGGWFPKYDVDAFERHAQDVFKDGELIHVTEKVHGANGKWMFKDGEMHCGSRTEWKREFPASGGPKNMWWQALDAHPEVRTWCEAHPGIVVYGEAYGKASLRYGVTKGVRIAVFDLYDGDRWMDAHAARLAAPELPWVPVVADVIEYDFDTLLALADGPSLVPGASNYREGIVVKPLHERTCDQIGRVQLKIVSPTYHEKKGKP